MTQKTYSADKSKAEEIITYLSKQSQAYSGKFSLAEGGEIKIRPYEGGIEIRCDEGCGEEILNKLEDIIGKK